MQGDTKKKNTAALIDPGPRKLLSELVNVPDSRRQVCIERAENFIAKYGSLRPGHPSPIDDLIDAAKTFRRAWHEAKGQDHEVETLERFLELLFTLTIPNEPYGRPFLKLDFSAGKWEPRPRTLIEHLALELVRARKMLHRCERPDCRCYFIKEESRDRYCQTRLPRCSEEMRRIGQERWAHENREKLNARRRKA